MHARRRRQRTSRIPPEQCCCRVVLRAATVHTAARRASESRTTGDFSVYRLSRSPSKGPRTRGLAAVTMAMTLLTGRVTRALAENDKEAAPARGPAPLRRFVFAAPQRLTRTRMRPLLRAGRRPVKTRASTSMHRSLPMPVAYVRGRPHAPGFSDEDTNAASRRMTRIQASKRGRVGDPSCNRVVCAT